MSDNLNVTWFSTEDENKLRDEFFELFRSCPIPQSEMLRNLGLFMNGPSLTRMLFMNELYQLQLPVHGNIMEFGVRWGQNLALWSEMRALYEPYNHNRKIIGFDTWEGFPSVHEKDFDIVEKGGWNVVPGYEDFLKKVLDYHEKENPISHIKKYELVKGDASVQLKKYLEDHPETMISMAYFDFDIYEPTKVCLDLIKDRLTRGSVIGFDELNQSMFPGETLAVMEVFGLSKYKIVRSQYSRVNSYLVID